MALRLRVVSAHSKGLGETASKVFGVGGGTVGRAEDNDWVLPDPERFISGHHVRIEYRQGEYWLADTSSNGTYVNDSDTPQSEQGSYALHDGDRIRMGDYEIAVTIDANNDFPPDNSAIVAFDGIALASPTGRSAQKATDEDIGVDLDLESLFGHPDDSSSGLTPVNAWGQAVESAAVSSSRRKRDENAAPKTPATSTPPVQTQPPAPAARREPPKKPAEPVESSAWHLSTRRVEPFRNPLRSSEPPAGMDGGDSAGGAQALFRGAGIDPSTLPPSVQAQAVQLAGQLLREMVLGMMDVLQARNELKNRFRIPDPSVTTPQTAEYNPLQFSAGVDEALRKLFEAQNKTSSRYLSPLEAVRESFHDLKTHQLAMTAALQTAFMEFLSHLDPAELQERFDRGLKRGGLLGAATNKMKYWELYSEFFQTLVQKQDLPHVFVEEFAQAYAAKVNEAATRKGRSSKVS
jgi:type VI secretion system protein